MDETKKAQIENVKMLDKCSKTPAQGRLAINTTALIFADDHTKNETWVYLSHISHLEKLPLTTTGSPLLIRTKTFFSVTFVIPREKDCHDVFVSLQVLSQPTNIQKLYCFTYNTSKYLKGDGWGIFNLQVEYRRMGVPNENWSLSSLNTDYELCDTYPKYIFVPALASEQTLIGSSKFRSKGRLPVLTYLHQNQAAICRSSQPLSGLRDRCDEDEKMLDHVLRTNPNSNLMYVVDTRPKINAMANRAAGKGYESEAYYDNIKFQFFGIENIHVMRNSLAKIVETCEQKHPTMNSFIVGLEASGWLRHIKSILDTSWFIASTVEDGSTVLVHCSDGWDRTAQVCALAELMLDPFYRTMTGYQTLIEKDWLAFGHKFSDRCGHIQTDGKEISPVFTQFLDATWQLMIQFPLSFEFNEHFLLVLHDHVHQCQFGTFLGNSEKERLQMRLSELTYSFWGHVAAKRKEYLNPKYTAEGTPGLIAPNLSPQNICFWRGMFYRFGHGTHLSENQEEISRSVYEQGLQGNFLEDGLKSFSRGLSSMRSAFKKTMKPKINKPRNSSSFYDYSSSSDPPNNTNPITDLSPKSNTSPTSIIPPILSDTTNYENHPLEVAECAQNSSFCDSSKSDGIDLISEHFNSIGLEKIKCHDCSILLEGSSLKTKCTQCEKTFCFNCITNGQVSGKLEPICESCDLMYHPDHFGNS